MTPQEEVHLELLGTFVDDDALNGIFLGRTEYPTVTLGATATGWTDGCPIAFFESVYGASYRWVGQSGQLNDLHDLDGLLVQSHDCKGAAKSPCCKAALLAGLAGSTNLAAATLAVKARTVEWQSQSATVSAMAERSVQGLTLRAVMAFGDEPKPGAKEALTTLRRRGIKTVMISGDNQGAAEAMAPCLGLRPEDGEVMAEVLLGEKAARVMALKEGVIPLPWWAMELTTLLWLTTITLAGGQDS